MARRGVMIYFYGVQGVASSNPAIPTNKINGLQLNGCNPFFIFSYFSSIRYNFGTTLFFTVLKPKLNFGFIVETALLCCVGNSGT